MKVHLVVQYFFYNIINVTMPIIGYIRMFVRHDVEIGEPIYVIFEVN